MFNWSNILHRRALRRLAQAAKEALAAREDAIVAALHRADHMQAERCGYCVVATRLQTMQSDGWARLEADVKADR